MRRRRETGDNIFPRGGEGWGAGVGWRLTLYKDICSKAFWSFLTLKKIFKAGVWQLIL